MARETGGGVPFSEKAGLNLLRIKKISVNTNI